MSDGLIHLVAALPFMLPIKGLAQAKNVTLQTSLVTALRSMRDGDKLVYVSSKDTPYEALTAYFEYGQPSGHVFLDKEKSAGAADRLVACAISGDGWGDVSVLPTDPADLDDFLEAWKPRPATHRTLRKLVDNPREGLTGADMLAISREAEVLMSQSENVFEFHGKIKLLVEEAIEKNNELKRENLKHKSEIQKLGQGQIVVREIPSSTNIRGVYDPIPYKDPRHTLLVKKIGDAPKIVSFFLAFREWLSRKNLNAKLVIFYDGTVYKSDRYRRIGGLAGIQAAATSDNITSPKVYEKKVITTPDGSRSVMEGVLAEEGTDLLIVLDVNAASSWEHIFQITGSSIETQLLFAVGSTQDADYLMEQGVEPDEIVCSPGCAVDGSIVEIPFLTQVPKDPAARMNFLVTQYEGEFRNLEKFSRGGW